MSLTRHAAPGGSKPSMADSTRRQVAAIAFADAALAGCALPPQQAITAGKACERLGFRGDTQPTNAMRC